MEDLKKAAKEFCEAESLTPTLNREGEDIHIVQVSYLPDLLEKFAQSLIDKNIMVEATKIVDIRLLVVEIIQEMDVEQEVQNPSVYRLKRSILRLLDKYQVSDRNYKSTVSSAGKEIADEYNDCPIDAAGLLADIDIFRILKLPNEAMARIELYTQSKINQFKSSPASTEPIEKLEQLKNMIKGYESLIKSLGQEIDSLKS